VRLERPSAPANAVHGSRAFDVQEDDQIREPETGDVESVHDSQLRGIAQVVGQLP